MNEEKVLVGGVLLNNDNEELFFNSLNELKQLVSTAFGKVITQVYQKRDAIDSKTIFGKGKILEIQEIIKDNDIETFVVNQEISPRQRANLEEILLIKVIDRTQLILDIFALHAKSKTGKLQVELAQIKYLLPQLSSMGHDLSKLGGGIGTRGPGETKLEQNRRVLSKNLTKIKHELDKIEQQRDLVRKNRQKNDVFQIGLVGYTNAGKSTLLNILTSANTLEENKLFATLDPLTRKYQFQCGLKATITDTVGFIQDLPTLLVESFKSTLEESQEMDVLLHVVDSSNPMRKQQEETVLQILEELELEDKPILTIYTKKDLCDDFVPTLYPNVIISKTEHKVCEKIEFAILELLKHYWQEFTKEVSLQDSYQINQIKETNFIVSDEFDEESLKYYLSGYTKR